MACTRRSRNCRDAGDGPHARGPDRASCQVLGRLLVFDRLRSGEFTPVSDCGTARCSRYRATAQGPLRDRFGALQCFYGSAGRQWVFHDEDRGDAAASTRVGQGNGQRGPLQTLGNSAYFRAARFRRVENSWRQVGDGVENRGRRFFQIQRLTAVRQGFEPWIQVLARITV